MGYHHFSHIVVADSHPLERLGISAILRLAFAWDKLESAVDYRELELLVNTDTSLVLLDLNLPGMTSHEHIRKLRIASPTTKLIVVSAPCGVDTLLSVLRSGVHGIVLKTLGQNDLVSALQTIARGQLYVPCELSEIPLLTSRAPDERPADAAWNLSARQREVLALAAQGCSNKEIARKLQIAEATVKVHASAAFRTMRVANRAQAVAAMKSHDSRGIIQPCHLKIWPPSLPAHSHFGPKRLQPRS